MKDAIGVGRPGVDMRMSCGSLAGSQARGRFHYFAEAVLVLVAFHVQFFLVSQWVLWLFRLSGRADRRWMLVKNRLSQRVFEVVSLFYTPVSPNSGQRGTRPLKQ